MYLLCLNIGCGRRRSGRINNDEVFIHRKFLHIETGADKAERKLSQMRQEESQYFRNFLQEWELQLEYARGREWPDSTKINHLRQSVGERIGEKFPVLGLPRHDYAKWVTKITEVAAIIVSFNQAQQKLPNLLLDLGYSRVSNSLDNQKINE